MPILYSRRIRFLNKASQSGVTLVETVVATALVALFFSSIHALNLHVWKLLDSGLESLASSRTVNGRAEQLRGATWAQITDPAFLRDSILSVAPDSGGRIGTATESITVTAYLAPGTVAPIQVNRTATGAVNIVRAGDSQMAAQPSVQVDSIVTWIAKGGLSHTRQFRIIFTQGGISGRK